MVSRGRAWAIAVVAILTMTVSYVDRSAFAVLAPTVTKELGISDAAYGWLSSAFSMSYLIGTPLAGVWIDRVGARRGLPRAVLLWSAVAALHAVAPGFAVLLALRILLGLAESPSFPGVIQTLTRALPPGDRERGIGGAFSGSSLGMMIAPPLCTFLFAVGGGWRFAFVGTAAVGLLWIPLFLAVTGGAARPQLANPATAARQGASLSSVMRHPAVLRGFLAILAVGPVTNLFGIWGPKYLVRAFGVTQLQVGHYMWLPPLALDVGAIVAGDLLSRGVRPRAVVGVILGASLGLLSVPWAGSPWQGAGLMALSTGVGGACYAVVTADVLRRVRAELGSTAVGMLAAAQSLSLIIANPLVGKAVDRLHSYDFLGASLVVWFVPGALLWLVWEPKVSGRAATPAARTSAAG